MSYSLEKQADYLVRSLLKSLPDDAKEHWAKQNLFLKYQNDPIGFGEEILGESYTDDIKKMMLSFRDNKITVAISCTGSGKSFSSATLATYAYKCFPNSQVWTAAAPPLDNLKTILWGEIGNRIHGHPEVFKNDEVTSLCIKRSSKSFIQGKAIPTTGTIQQRETKFSGIHAPYLFFILDEGDAIPDEVYKGIDGCMSGGYTRMLIMFNPRYQSGFVHRLINEGLANVVHLTAFNHPNVITGMDMIPGAVTREATLERINEWTFPLFEDEEPNNECFEVPEFLVGCPCPNSRGGEYPPLNAGFRRVIKPEFWYKVLGKYPPAGPNQLISKEAIDRARSRWDLYVAANGEKPPEGIKPILGLDVGDMGDDASVICARYGGYVARIRHRFFNTDPDMVAEKVIPIAKQLNSHIVNVDSIGVGAGVAPKLKRNGVKAARIMVSDKPVKTPSEEKKKKVKFRRLRDQLWWNAKEFIERDDTAMLPPNRELIEELLVATYEEDDNGDIRVLEKSEMREKLGRSPNDADAFNLTLAPKKDRPRAELLN
jgi:hypothetical protein